jgi:predicted flap endonuclease-1-like 5' DNA nuclease
MSNSPITDQFYNNTSFSDEEKASLKSNFLGFGQTLTISFGLLKKRISNVFFPVLVWQLLLFILFFAFQLMLVFGIINNLPTGTISSLPTPFNQQTLEITPEFKASIENLVKLPAILGYISLMSVVFLAYIIISKWIDFKTNIMLNDKDARLFDGNSFLGRFWVLILFLIIYSVLINSISDIFEIQLNPFANTILGIAGFVFSFIASYVDVIARYIGNIYLIEKTNFWSAFGTGLQFVKKYILGDFLRHLVSLILIVVTIVLGYLIFGGIGLGLLLPLDNVGTANSGIGIVLIILFGLVMFLALGFTIFLSWLAESFLYVAFYNLRMLDLHQPSGNTQSPGIVNIMENREPTQTLEEKLMQNNIKEEGSVTATTMSLQNVESSQLNASTVEITSPNLENSNTTEQEAEAMEEYKMMDIERDFVETTETKPEPTIINPNHTKIVGIANIKKSNSARNLNDDDSATATTVSPQKLDDDLKIIEGIGPKINELLNENGITTFAHLANTSVEELKAILEKGGSRFTIHNPTNWPNQAELARDGKMEELEVLKEELINGK